ncbi:MAG: O-antigen ligase family protein, partial [Desulfitobacteriaceae bacterium]
MKEDFWDQSGSWVNKVATVVALGILLKAAWSRGLFFQEDFLIVHIILGVLGLCFLPFIFSKGKFKFNFLDGVFLYLGLAYTISILGSANVGLAIGETLRVWTYILYYFILSRALFSESIISLYINGIIAISTAIALFGLLTVPRILDYEGSWDSGLLNSTLQYHNAFAGFLIAPMILAIYLWLNEFETKRGCLYSVAFMIMSIGLAGSQSRGGYLIFALAILVFLIVYRTNRQSLVLLLMPILNILAGTIIWGRFLSASTAQATGAVWAWLAVGVLTSLVVHFGGRLIKRLLYNQPGTFLKTLLVLALLGLIVAGVYEFIHSGSDVLTKIKSINIHDHAVEERFTIYGDTVKMVLQRPLTGYGGGGWSTAYRSVQSYLYNSTETHSIFFKVVVETGLLGLLALMLIPFALIRMTQRTLGLFKESNSNNQSGYFWVTVMAAVGIIAHALIDFDLSEGALSLLLWGLLAILRGLSLQAEKSVVTNSNQELTNKANLSKGRAKKSKVLLAKGGLAQAAAYRLPLGIVLGLVSSMLIVVPLLIKSETKNASSAGKLLNQREYQAALNLYDSAEEAFPFQATDWLGSSQASMRLAISNQDRSLVDRAISDSSKAVDLNRFDAMTLNNKANILTQAGEEADAYQALIKVKDLAPFYSVVYYNLGNYAIGYAMNAAKDGNLTLTKEVAQYIADLPEQIKTKLDSLSPFYRRNWVDPQRLEVTPELQLVVAESKVLLGQAEGEKELVTLLTNQNTAVEAKLWLGAIAIKTG